MFVRLVSMAFRAKEGKELLLDLDSYGGVDPLNIFPLFLKKCSDLLAPKMSTLFRWLIRRGEFPKSWRVAHVTPIPKGPVSPYAKMYRPISITPVISKIFEKLLSKRLVTFFENNSVFPKRQYAYRRGLGTCDALLDLVTSAQVSLENRLRS